MSFTEFPPNKLGRVFNDMRARLEADLYAAFGVRKQRPTALAYRNGAFVTLEIDDAGNVIEPPPKCPHCGPILWCPKHSPS